MWEAEDPDNLRAIRSHLQRWVLPLGDDDGNPLPGYTVINVGLPTFSRSRRSTQPLRWTAAPATSPRISGSAAVTASSDYFLERGWITSVAHRYRDIVDPATMAPERYRPSVLQWYMRLRGPRPRERP